MNPPDDGTKIYDMAYATCWIDEDGIFNTVTKYGPYTVEATKEHVELSMSILGGKKAFVLCDFSKGGYIDKHIRKYIRENGRKVYGAFAILADSALGKVMGKILLALMPSSVPTRIFTKEE